MKEAKLEALGSTKTDYLFDGPHNHLLERFESPFWQTPERQEAGELEEGAAVRNEFGAGGSVHIEIPEFTSLCPKTGQPDFAHIVLDFVPGDWLVESKSLKLFLGSFRNHGAFHEDCTVTIGKRLVDLLAPKWLRVGGYWYPRGGIPIDIFYQTGAQPDTVWIPDQGVPTYRGRG